jgi:hypothetical protein
MEFIKDKVLGPLLVAAVLAMCAVIAAQFDKRLFIHLLGGVGDLKPFPVIMNYLMSVGVESLNSDRFFAPPACGDFSSHGGLLEYLIRTWLVE